MFTYEDVATAARNPAVFSSNHGLGIPDHGFPVRMPPIEIDPPQHIQFRAPLLHRFSPIGVGAFGDEIHRAVTELIDGFIENGSADLARDLAGALPGAVIPHFLSIPAEDRDKFRDWAVRQMQVAGDLEATGDMFEYFFEMYDDRMARPQDPLVDLPSLMLTISIDDRSILPEEFTCMMAMLVIAGMDTTANGGANMLQVLARRQELRRELTDDLSRIPKAVEELLRFVTPVALEGRVITQDVEIRGVSIPAGERVALNWLAANHDPAEFADPERISFDRSPNRHFGFGAGPHRCLGAHLARLELQVMIEEVLKRLPDYELVDDGIVRYGGMSRGISALPVKFNVGHRLGKTATPTSRESA
ncbi:MAG TPA: cytochrome P450 [Acidimicrobiales bacterium]|nr:cytochrome P450 [Acidimicrobiales bacterium]